MYVWSSEHLSFTEYALFSDHAYKPTQLFLFSPVYIFSNPNHKNFAKSSQSGPTADNGCDDNLTVKDTWLNLHSLTGLIIADADLNLLIIVGRVQSL